MSLFLAIEFPHPHLFPILAQTNQPHGWALFLGSSSGSLKHENTVIRVDTAVLNSNMGSTASTPTAANGGGGIIGGGRSMPSNAMAQQQNTMIAAPCECKSLSFFLFLG